MINNNSTGQSPNLLSLSPEEIKKIFKRKNPEVILKEKRKIELYDRFLTHFNPETDVIVPKEVLILSNQLKEISRLSLKIEQIDSIQKNVSTKVDELHSIQTGKLYVPEGKTLNKKQKEKAELLELQKNAHLRVLNRIK